MVSEDTKINPLITKKKYIIRFKRKDLRPNKRDDKVEILKKLTGLGDFENYVNISDLKRSRHKYEHYNKAKTGRNETDRYNPIAPNTETIHDINEYDFPIVMMKLSSEQYHRVRKDPNIELIEEDYMVYHHMSSSSTITASPQTTPYGISMVKAPESWTSSKRKGEGVRIGVIDSGILYTHADLADNYFGGVTFVPGTTSPIDEGTPAVGGSSQKFWHGTHISGTIAAIDNQEGVVGVAPRSELVSYRCFGPSVLGTPESILITALETTIQDGIYITNNSYGGPGGFSQTRQAQIQRAFDSGMLFCASAGNEGNKTMDPANPNSKQNYPCGYPAAIEVSSVDEQTNSSTFSNYGTKTEFAAPGTLVLSTYPPSEPGSGYAKLSGSSMACPHVVGAFAMGFAAWRYSPCSDMYSLSPQKNEVLRQVARQTANKLGKFTDRDPTNAYGYGIIDVNAFVKKLLNPDIHIKTVA